MAAPTPVEFPASRLRLGDVVVAYGPQARVLRSPVISVDGAMVNVLVADPETGPESSRLVRLPVGLRIEVLRPAEPESSFVRLAKVAKSSGARIVVLNLHHPDSEIAPVGREQFATLCTVHHAFKTHPGISTAEAQASHPEQWCSPCAEAARQRAHARVYGPDVSRVVA